MGKVYYKRAVGYDVGVRYFRGDADGKMLTRVDPVVEVDSENLKEFKLANKRVILEGLIVETAEPQIEWESDNQISDEELSNILKQYLVLKQRLQKIDSLPILYRFMEAAREQDKSKKIISLIQARIDEVGEDEEDFSYDKEDMKGVS